MTVLSFLATQSAANDIESFTNLDNTMTVREQAEPEWVPPGFEGLNANQETVIDIFYGGYFLTTALTRFTKREVTILDVELIVDRLNDLSDPDRIRELLAIPFYSNFEKICKSKYSVECGRLDTTSVDIIFDISKLRIDLFISPTLLLTRSLDQLAFLPPSDAGFSVLDDLSIFASGSSKRSPNFNIANSTLIAYAENRLFMRSNYTDTDNFGVDSIYLQQEFEGRSYQAGIFRSNAGSFIFMRDYQFLGVALESSLATRIDLNFSLGNEIEVFLDSRSHVEIYKDDRLIRTQYYEAGNQILDTRGLPHGSYDIELRITDSANRRRTEIRFFSKTSRLPPADQSLYFVQAGEVLLADDGRIFPTGTGEKFVRAGYSKRLTATFGGSIGVSRNQESSMLEAGFFNQGKKYELQSIFAYDSYGVAAVDFRFRYRFGSGEVIINSRKIWNQDIPADEISQIGNALVQNSIYATFRTNYGVGSVFYRFNERGGRDSEENYGARWSLNRLFGLSNFSGNFEISRNNNSNFLLMSLNYRIQKEQWTHTASTRYQLDEGVEGDAGSELLGSVASSWKNDSTAANSYLVSLRADHQPENSLESRIDARTSLGQGIITMKYSPDDEVIDYDASLNTSFVATSKGFGMGGYRRSTTGFLIKINGDPELNVLIDVMVDGSRKATLVVNSTRFVPVSAYKIHKLEFQPVGNTLLNVEPRQFRKSMYPGNVISIEVEANEIVIAIGWIIDEAGAPLENALLKDVVGLATTDTSGFFQAEIYRGAEAIIVKKGGVECQVKLGEYIVRNKVAFLGKLVCIP